jgi:hypothetical protein
MPPATLSTVLSRLPMALATGFPVGRAVLSPTPTLTPMLASRPGHTKSAGSAEAMRATESVEMIVVCFILETIGRIGSHENEKMRRGLSLLQSACSALML